MNWRITRKFFSDLLVLAVLGAFAFGAVEVGERLFDAPWLGFVVLLGALLVLAVVADIVEARRARKERLP